MHHNTLEEYKLGLESSPHRTQQRIPLGVRCFFYLCYKQILQLMKKFFFVAVAVILAAACAENKKAEQTYPVGDRALFEVVGNAESVDFTQDAGGELFFLSDNITFDKKGLFFVKDIKMKESKEGELTVLTLDTDDEDGGGEEFVECKYDSRGRLVSVGFWEASFSDIKYDDQDRVVSYTAYGFMGIESEHHYTFTYGKDNNPVRVDVKENHPDYENEGKTLTKNYSFSYEYTAVDDKGNWTERKRDDGEVEKRTIKYFAE